MSAVIDLEMPVVEWIRHGEYRHRLFEVEGLRTVELARSKKVYGQIHFDLTQGSRSAYVVSREDGRPGGGTGCLADAIRLMMWPMAGGQESWPIFEIFEWLSGHLSPATVDASAS